MPKTAPMAGKLVELESVSLPHHQLQYPRHSHLSLRRWIRRIRKSWQSPRTPLVCLAHAPVSSRHDSCMMDSHAMLGLAKLYRISRAMTGHPKVWSFRVYRHRSMAAWLPRIST